MTNAFAKVVDIILLIIVMTFSAILFFSAKSDALAESYTKNQTGRLLESVAEKGYLTQDMWEAYLSELSGAGLAADISLTGTRYCTEPVYDMYSVTKADEMLKSLWTGENTLVQADVATSLPVVDITAGANASLNTETNASILAASVNTPSSGHLHTIACYAGHNHAVYGCTYHGHVSSCYTNYPYSYNISCTACGGDGLVTCTGSTTTTYTYYEYGATKCPIHGDFPAADVWVTKCNVCGTVISVIKHWYCSALGTQTTTSNPHAQISCSACGGDGLITYSGTTSTLTCGKAEGWSCGYTVNDTAAMCGQIVLSIHATNPIQTVYQDETLITTAVVTYLDGSQKTVLCTAEKGTAHIGTYSVILSLTGYASAGNMGTFTDTISVTVIPKNAVCENGHLYPAAYSQCPYCDAYVESIALTGAAMEQGRAAVYSGTTLQESGYSLYVTYMDKDTELIANGWTDNLDNDYVGLQEVTISYKGKTEVFPVVVYAETKTCDSCGFLYALNPDKSDPGCPYCFASVPYFTGQSMSYTTIIMSEDIMNGIYGNERRYIFAKGDTITVEVKNRKRSVILMLLSDLFPGIGDKLNISMQESITVRSDDSYIKILQ